MRAVGTHMLIMAFPRHLAEGGFSGSTFMTPAHSHESEHTQKNPMMNPGHLPSTYTSLLVLGILRAPVEEWINKLDVDGLERLLDTCSDSNGSYVSLRFFS